MAEPFSRRNQEPPEAFRYDVPATTRKRFLITISDMIDSLENQLVYYMKTAGIFSDALYCAAKAVARRDGELSIEYQGINANVAAQHFAACPDEKALDFIEYFFQFLHAPYVGLAMIEANRIFQQDGLGYELVPEKQPGEFERPIPIIVRKYGEYVHENVIRPCLESLRHPDFATANEEMLQAHKDYRDGNYGGTIVNANASLESVMKTVLSLKGKTGHETQTINTLSLECSKEGVYPTFVHEIVKNTGAIRNKMGGHGGGHQPEHIATKEFADYMLQLTASHINMIVQLAGV